MPATNKAHPLCAAVRVGVTNVLPAETEHSHLRAAQCPGWGGALLYSQGVCSLSSHHSCSPGCEMCFRPTFRRKPLSSGEWIQRHRKFLVRSVGMWQHPAVPSELQNVYIGAVCFQVAKLQRIRALIAAPCSVFLNYFHSPK